MLLYNKRLDLTKLAARMLMPAHGESKLHHTRLIKAFRNARVVNLELVNVRVAHCELVCVVQLAL